MHDTVLEKYQGRILDHVHEGIAIIDADGRCSFVNPDGSETDPAETPVFLVIQTGEPVHGAEYAVKRMDGSTSMIVIDAEPFREETGRLMGALISSSDVTEARRVQHLSDALNDINNAVIGNFDTHAVMQQALDMAVAALGCESGVVYLQDGADWTLHYLSGLPDSMDQLQVRPLHSSMTYSTTFGRSRTTAS